MLTLKSCRVVDKRNLWSKKKNVAIQIRTRFKRARSDPTQLTIFLPNATQHNSQANAIAEANTTGILIIIQNGIPTLWPNIRQ